MAVCIVVCMIVGYLFGCIQTGYIVGRVNKIDIRDYGSGNSGTTNTLRTLGKTAAIITFLGDAVKGLVAVNLARYVIMPAFHVEGEAYLWLLTGFAVVLGHNFPFYLGFKGGKGIATTGGVIFAFHWQLGLVLQYAPRAQWQQRACTHCNRQRHPPQLLYVRVQSGRRTDRLRSRRLPAA